MTFTVTWDLAIIGTWQLAKIPLCNHFLLFMTLERPIYLAGLRNDCWIHLWVAMNWRSRLFQSSYLSGSVKRAPFMQMQLVCGIKRPICSSLMKGPLNIGFQRNNNDKSLFIHPAILAKSIFTVISAALQSKSIFFLLPFFVKLFILIFTIKRFTLNVLMFSKIDTS